MAGFYRNQDLPKIAANGCATTPVDGRLPPQAIFGPAFMPGIRGPTPRREAR